MIEHWQEHFKVLFFNLFEVHESAIENLPKLELIQRMDRIPAIEEVEKAVRQINSRKAPVFLPVDLLQTESESVRQETPNLMINNWRGSIPQDWVDGILISIYKSKGDKSTCDTVKGDAMESTQKAWMPTDLCTHAPGTT